jgi:hypothetical protein
MTDYNDGNWHEWKGGECPVERRALVQVLWVRPEEGFMGGPYSDVDWAGDLCWDHDGKADITDFRVIEPAASAPADPYDAVLSEIKI